MNKQPEHRVLVVDDDELQRDILCMQLEQLGWTDVATAASGEEALAFFDRTTAGVIICDLSMPQMDGLVLMRHLAQRGVRAAILLLSGSDEEILQSAEGLAHAHGLDIRGVVRKPCALDQLETLMAACRAVAVVPANLQLSDALSAERLRAALEAGEFLPWYQPKVDLATGRAIGVEALARWAHPSGIAIGPGLFVPALEAAGLVDELFFQIAQAAARDTARWRAHGILGTTAINLSMDTARNLSLPERLGAIVKGAGLQNTDFVIEVTESRLMVERSSTMETLTRLSLLGFTLSIDDFGTGYSSLVQLIDLPFHELKIDGGFVRRANTERKAQAIVQIALMLGDHLHMKVIAEGVETTEQLAQLRQWGGAYVQGYHFARPMPFEACTDWLKAH